MDQDLRKKRDDEEAEDEDSRSLTSGWFAGSDCDGVSNGICDIISRSGRGGHANVLLWRGIGGTMNIGSECQRIGKGVRRRSVAGASCRHVYLFIYYFYYLFLIAMDRLLTRD